MSRKDHDLPAIIRVASSADAAGVLALYAAANYGAGVEPDDRVIVAVEQDEVIGAVRLCPEQGVTVLRGMQVGAAHQRCGVGSAMLAACAAWLDQGIAYCLPYAHLLDFYGSAGFRPVAAGALPGFLRRRLDDYLGRGHDVVALVRVPGADLHTAADSG